MSSKARSENSVFFYSVSPSESCDNFCDIRRGHDLTLFTFFSITHNRLIRCCKTVPLRKLL